MGLRKSRTFTGAGGENAIVELIMATHAGMTTEQFEKIVKGWIGSAKNPKTDRLVAEMIYEPMLKLLAICAPTASRSSSSPSRNGIC